MIKSTSLNTITALLCIWAAALTVTGCNGPEKESDEELFLLKNGVCMVVGTKVYIDGDQTSLQISYNDQKHIYRAGIPVIIPDEQAGSNVEIVQESYVLVLDGAPSGEGASVTGSLYLTSQELRNGSQKYENVVFTIKRMKDNLVWLWSADNHIGVVIQVS